MKIKQLLYLLVAILAQFCEFIMKERDGVISIS